MSLEMHQTSCDSGLSPRHFHVFLSSPGDVGEERRLIGEIIQTRLAKDAFLRGRVTFDVISWDDPNAPTPMPANLTPQDAVVRFGRRPAECEVVIVVLWSRLGTHLDTTKFTKPNGEPYLSGTEWEYEDASNADPPPDILLYRRMEKPRIDIDDPEFGVKKHQYDLVDAFLARFRNADGSFAGSVTGYETPSALAQRVVSDLSSLLSRRLGLADRAITERLATLEHIANQAIAANEALQQRVRELGEQQTLKDDTIRSLNAAMAALVALTDENEETKLNAAETLAKHGLVDIVTSDECEPPPTSSFLIKTDYSIRTYYVYESSGLEVSEEEYEEAIRAIEELRPYMNSSYGMVGSMECPQPQTESRTTKTYAVVRSRGDYNGHAIRELGA